MSEEILSSVNAEPEVNVEPQQTEETQVPEQAEEQSVKTEEVAEPQKPVQTPEENAKFAAIRREAEAKAREKARDELIAEMFGASHGIFTYADYQKAVQTQKEQQEAERLAQQNIPEDLVREIIESRKFRQQWESERKTIEERQQREAEYQEFLEVYPDVKPSEIPSEVWQMVNQGKRLADAYRAYENKQLKAKIAEYENKFKALETNQKNAETSPGSVTGQGEIKGDFISLETFNANKHDRNWVIKNFKQIIESRAKW